MQPPPAGPPASATALAGNAPAPEKTAYKVEFTGTGAEYFRVWIVNIALTIVTLGIYSAWAKVRNKQYFYGNSRLAGGSFEYTANPINILKGRIIVFGVFVAYQLAVTFQPVAAMALALFIVPLLPWMIIKAIGFNLRYSSYRGLRFHFDGGYWEAFRVYLLWTIGAVASSGLAYPYVAWRRRQFFVDRSRFGQSGFRFGGEVGFFYVVYVIAVIASIGIVLAAILLVTAAIAAFAMIAGGTPDDLGKLGEAENMGALGKGLAIASLVAAYVGYFLLFLVISAAIQAVIANHVWQRTRIDDVGFHLDLNPWLVVWIRISNIVAIIASVGLLIPWAKVRMTRYWLSRFTMLANPQDLQRFLAAERERVEATGAEFGDALDLDLGI